MDRNDETALASLGGFFKSVSESGSLSFSFPLLSPNEIAIAMTFDLIVLITCILACVLVTRGNNMNAYATLMAFMWFLTLELSFPNLFLAAHAQLDTCKKKKKRLRAKSFGFSGAKLAFSYLAKKSLYNSLLLWPFVCDFPLLSTP